MHVTVLGRYGPYPSADGGTSSYLLHAKNANILIDCGSGACANLQQHIKLADLDAAILSHLHNDHIADIGVMAYAMAQQNRVMDVYIPLYQGNDLPVFSHPALNIKPVVAGEQMEINSLHVAFYPTQHPVPCNGMRISDGRCTLAYTGDGIMDHNMNLIAKDADVLIADANYRNESVPENPVHMTAEQAALLALEGNVKKLILSHLHPEVDKQALLSEAKQKFENTVIAQQGKTYPVC